MGWFGSSSPPSESSPANPKSSTSSSPPPPPAQQEPQTPQPPKIFDREVAADEELARFLSSFQDPSTTTSPSSSSPDTSPSTTAPSRSTIPVSHLSKISDTPRPTSFSCRDAFDYAFYCRSPGGQFLNVYRYGEWRSCSQHWGEFWQCMRTKGMGEKRMEEAKDEKWIEREKRWRKNGVQSSEDIWASRTEKVTDAFSLAPPERIEAPRIVKGEGSSHSTGSLQD